MKLKGEFAVEEVFLRLRRVVEPFEDVAEGVEPSVVGEDDVLVGGVKVRGGGGGGDGFYVSGGG